MVPSEAKQILSIGCGWGATEAALQKRGAEVTALPLDSVIGQVAERQGIKVMYGTLRDSFKRLAAQRFDAVVITNLLHLQRNPGQILEQCASFVQEDGVLAALGPNFDRVPWLMQRVLGRGDFRKLRSFELSGIAPCGPRSLAKHFRKAGFCITDVKWINASVFPRSRHGARMQFGRLTARDWVLRARRRASDNPSRCG
jgi:2-polyprenyl-3-methyl-5-hydroxy-6-metoxy-1,4-benzoquinol methylase